jgi:hypothetical protein
MALSRNGAGYVGRENVKDQYDLEAKDDLANQIAAVRVQANLGKDGPPDPPSKPSGLAVSSQSKLFTATILHPNAPPGTQWVLQYSTSPNFQAPITVGLLHNTWQSFLPGQTLFFRVAAKFAASEQTAWTYLGTSVQPLAVS